MNLDDEETAQALRQVRKELYFGGFRGLVVGTLLGAVGFSLAKKYSLVKFESKIHGRNMFAATVLISGAFGSFLFSLKNGINAWEYLGAYNFMGKLSMKSSPYLRQLYKNDDDLLNSMDAAFLRRKEAIEKHAKESKFEPPSRE